MPDTADGHGSNVSNSVWTQFKAGLPTYTADDMKMMYVITDTLRYDNTRGKAAIDYIIDKKLNRDVNIVAVGTFTSRTDRASRALNAAGIMLIGGGTAGTGANQDGAVGDESDAFYSATPRRGIQKAPLDNLIPVTTDPTAGLTDTERLCRDPRVSAHFARRAISLLRVDDAGC